MNKQTLDVQIFKLRQEEVELILNNATKEEIKNKQEEVYFLLLNNWMLYNKDLLNN